MPIKTLAEFYTCMQLLQQARAKIVNAINVSDTIDVKDLKYLEQIKINLEDIPRNGNLYELKTSQGKSIELELDYELHELRKDDIFLKHGHKALKDHMCKIHKNYEQEVNDGFEFLKKHSFKHFVTDRDGTITNYCGRYQSSIQSIYNALCLSEFKKAIDGRSIILTSAPLQDIGLADVSIQPEGEFILAGSKGRELLLDYKKHTFPIEEHQQRKLNELNEAIDKLLEREEFSSFRYIGSGLQHKFGQTTLARQDKNNSISAKKSQELKNSIENLLQKLDPSNSYFSLEDTGKDLEIMLKINSGTNNLEEFDKGHGLKFIMKHLDEDIRNESLLICGDTASDVPLITAAQHLGAGVTSVFVTEDENLKDLVKAKCKDAFFVSSPDVLIYMLYKYSKHQNSWNPVNLFLSLVS